MAGEFALQTTMTRSIMFTGFTGAFVDREAESKGLDFIDREYVYWPP